tara:strand:- start:96 stop:536 length:441 start_codon:yes stop_codon:yes gene_type:complete
LIIYLGAFFILFGIIFLIIPLIYIEVGRPKDLLKAGLNFIIGIIFIFKNRVFENSYPAIYFLLTLLISFYVVEIFTTRWNQFTYQEKNKLITLVELKNNLSKISEAISLGVKNFINFLNLFKFEKNNENINKKKWVRNDKNDNIKI